MLAAGQDYGAKRDVERQAEWLKNVRRILPTDKVVVFQSTSDFAKATPVGDDDPGRPIAVHVADRGTDAQVSAFAEHLFRDRKTLRWYVGLIGGGARMLVKGPSGPMQTLRETDPLPKELMRDAGILRTEDMRLPPALILLGWHQAVAASDGITRMAEIELGNEVLR